MGHSFKESWAEFERLRRLVPERPDWHLHQWGLWCRGEKVTDGYDERSAGLSTGGISGEDSFQHLCEPTDDWAASVTDTIIEDPSFPSLYRMILQNVYAASVFKAPRIDIDKTLVEAAAAYWKEALKRDLT